MIFTMERKSYASVIRFLYSTLRKIVNGVCMSIEF